MNYKTRTFIREHREDDVRRLALQGRHHPDVDMPLALQQIAGWQTARKKLPSWATVDEIVYPQHLSMEQCSSEQTARYKMGVAARLITHRERLVDLTGGLGVDFAHLAGLFDEGVYVERDPALCDIAHHNFDALGLTAAKVVNGEATDFLQRMEHADLIYIDPARRDTHGGRTFAIGDCTPNVLEMRQGLLDKGRWVMVKLSPMLDWHKAVADLNGAGDVVREVHIVGVGNECKELLILLSDEHRAPLTVCCVNDDSVFAYSTGEDSPFDGLPSAGSETGIGAQNSSPRPVKYLYEPYAPVMKAGCFDVLQRRHNVTPLARNSHLFVSADFIESFPGRKFQISAISSVGRNVTKLLPDVTGKANVAVRNFPMTAEQLRKKLKLKDGGDTYLFGTTLENNGLVQSWEIKPGPVLLITKKT